MASIVLGVAGSAAGMATGVPFLGQVGQHFGQGLGRSLDGAVLSPSRKLRPLHGARLAELAMQTSTYGRMIPIVYGTMRIAGNIIWSLPIREVAVTTTSSAGGGGKGGGKITQSATSYSYSVTLAIAICEGPVDQVLRVWADARQLDLSQYTARIYEGGEEQLPDSLIQSIEGADKTPAFRGLAYVVLEDFPMGDFGNRIPNFTFEVQKKALHPDYGGEVLEEMISGVVMIPGAGEFVYDTQPEYKIPGEQVGAAWVQQGAQQSINTHTPQGIANALVALDQLKKTCPNTDYISVVVGWFGTSLDAASCEVLPGVEYAAGAITTPDLWQVAGRQRSAAHLITQIGGSAQYGGTPDDDSIVRYITELRARGYKVAFYPLLFMDVAGKPWRGELTGSAAAVSAFFTKANGYNAFIAHYASLVAGKVDAFIIGSELKGLTKVSDAPGSYPAVDALAALAAQLRAILGSGVTLTYAADWSEYHHTDGGWYNMDPLWASPDIDVIGIDAYFPLTATPQSGYDIDSIINGWESGEGYDFYYTDAQRTVQAPLSAPYAWKNIGWFWDNTHSNPDSSATGWVPQSKKIWFTEYGFPSVDGAANQPNVFYDPASSGSAFPYFSKGRVDFLAQRAALTATQQKWKDSPMIERMFVWAWDARPFPYWPDLMSVWADGANWKTGHWVQGKLGTSSLAAIVADLCMRAGLQAADIDVSRLAAQVDGFIIPAQQTFRHALEALQSAYFFDVVESDNTLKFVPQGGAPVLTIPGGDIVMNPEGAASLSLLRTQEIELPKRVNVVFLSRLANYQNATEYAQREVTASMESVTLELPLVCTGEMARTVAAITLYSAWMARTGFQFDLPVSYAMLEPSDVIRVSDGSATHTMRIISTRLSAPSVLSVKAVADDGATFDAYNAPAGSTGLLLENQPVSPTQLQLLDIPAFPGDDADRGVLRAGGCGTLAGWRGAALYRSDDNGANFTRLTDLNAPAAQGNAVNALAVGPVQVFDLVNTLSVLLLGDATLQGVSELAVLNGANAALVGDEVIQFTTATLTGPGKYTLGGLLRGRLGTEWAAGAHVAGEHFALLDGRFARMAMPNNLLNLPRQYKPVSFGSSLATTAAQDFTYRGVGLRPYSPVHIAGTRDAGGNLTISWVRRTRLGGEWQDATDIALNETAETYEVDIMNGGTAIRTITGLSTPNASYAAADQVADFGAAQGSVSVRIYQMSAAVGRGTPGSATI